MKIDDGMGRGHDKIAIERHILASLIGLAKVAASAREGGESDRVVGLAMDSASAYAELVRIVYGLGKDEVMGFAMRAASGMFNGSIAETVTTTEGEAK